MGSLIFNSCLDDAWRGLIDFENDDFKVMLVQNSYIPNKDTHTKRSDVIGDEVPDGDGYTAGGADVTINVVKDLAADKIDVSLGGANWPASTIQAQYAVYYKSRGGAPSADEILVVIDFGGNVNSTNGTFTLSNSTLRIQN